MSKDKQTKKNIDLTEKLIKFIFKKKYLSDFPQDVSFVPFSNSDEELNKANEELLESLVKEEKPVVKAEEPKTKYASWKITPINF